MPGDHGYDEKKHKERVKKLKAKTSKMRLAAINNRPWAKKSVSLFDEHIKSQFPNITGKRGRPSNKSIKEDYHGDYTDTPESEFGGIKENRDNYINELAVKYNFETPLGRDERRYISEQERRESKGLKRKPYYYPDGTTLPSGGGM